MGIVTFLVITLVITVVAFIIISVCRLWLMKYKIHAILRSITIVNKKGIRRRERTNGDKWRTTKRIVHIEYKLYLMKYSI